MKKKTFKRWTWSAAIALLLLVLLGAAIHRGNREQPVSVVTETVQLRDLTRIVSATGRIHPETEVKISSEVAGEIVELAVAEGARVEAGDLLVRIKPDTYEAQLRQREAALNGARAQSLQRQAELLQAEQDLGRMELLFQRGFSSQSEIEAARTRTEIQRASYEASLYQIKEQETLLEEVREQLSKTTVYSPRSGTIIVVNAEVGERVVGTGQFAGTEILRIGDLTNMEVRIQVSENDIVNVEEGNPTRITIDAFPNRTFTGHVTEISSSASGIDSPSREEAITFEVRIRMTEPDPRIRPGMTAIAEIETQTVSQVVSVPLQSVTVRDRKDLPEALLASFDAGGNAIAGDGSGGSPLERIVFVCDGNRAFIRLVETGLANNEHIEILRGLEESEWIVSGSYSAVTRQLNDGSLIVIE